MRKYMEEYSKLKIKIFKIDEREVNQKGLQDDWFSGSKFIKAHHVIVANWQFVHSMEQKTYIANVLLRIKLVATWQDHMHSETKMISTKQHSAMLSCYYPEPPRNSCIPNYTPPRRESRLFF